MTKKTIDADAILNRARPQVHQHAPEIQPFGHLVKLPIALSGEVCTQSVENLNQLLADTITLRDLYKKHHWQVAGPTFYQLHLLFDKHYEQQNELVDAIAERIQLLGGVSVAMAPDVAEITLIPRPPKGREEAPVQISRLLHAHEIVLKEALRAAQAEGAQVELVRLDELRLPSGPDPEQPDDAWWFWERLMAADGLIVSAPIVSRTITGRLKLLMDRLLGPNADRAIVEKLIAVREAGDEPAVPFRLD